MNVDRRTVLQVSGLVAVGGVVAACSSGSNGTTASAAAPEPAASSAPAGGAAGGGAIAKTADIPVGGGLVLENEAVVITQPSEGDFKAFSAVCTHQGCLVASVADNTISCPCHGSQFSATDGSVVKGPATAPLAAAGIAVEGGDVVLS